MIWFTLALFAVSFVMTALLAPEPKLENARADELNPDTFPRATENAPITIALGKVRHEAPNTIWWGGFRTVAIKERVRVSAFKKKSVTVGHEYHLSMDLALALGPGVRLTAVYMDDKLLWEGNTSATQPTEIHLKNRSLFGGHKEGGGFEAHCTFYPGGMDLVSQPVDAFLESQVGAGNVPAYLGVSHIVMKDAYIGESAQLRKVAFVLECYTNGLGLPNNGMIGEEMNPAEAIHQLSTNNWRGMGTDQSNIDLPALYDFGVACLTEGNGVSIEVTAESNGKSLIQEILRQVDGIAYQDPESGKIVYKLIRNDYNLNEIPHFDEDSISAVTQFSRSSWDEVKSQVKITFPQRDKESEAVAISQDMATYNMIGRLRSTTISMPFCYDPVNANNIASRERSQLSVPLFNMDIEFLRNANKLRPGMVFSISWPEYDFERLILRVQSFDAGSLLDGKILVNCLQDRYSLADTVFAPPAQSGWVEPVRIPSPILRSKIVELPKFLSNILEYAPPDGKIAVVPMASRPNAASSSFDMIASETSGDLIFVDPEYAEYVGSGVIMNTYPESAGFATGQDNSVGISISGAGFSMFTQSATDAQIREAEAGILYIDGEWLGYKTAINMGGGTWRLEGIYRGLFGTTAKTHAVGTEVYEVSTDYFTSGQTDDLSEGDTLFYKLLDRVGPKIIEENLIAQNSITFTGNIANRPVRPANAQIGGQRLNIVVNDYIARTLTWNRRNRMVMQTSFEMDPDQVPDIAEAYDIDIMVNGVRNSALSGTSATASYEIPFSLVDIQSGNCEARIRSRRTVGDLRSSLGYASLPFSMNQQTTLPKILGTSPYSGSDSDLSVSTNIPSGATVGQTLIASVYTTSAFTPPAGWTLVNERSVLYGGTTYKQTILNRTVTGAEGTSVPFSQATAGPIGAIIALAEPAAVVYSGGGDKVTTDRDTVFNMNAVEAGRAVFFCSSVSGGVFASSVVTIDPQSPWLTMTSGNTRRRQGAGHILRPVAGPIDVRVVSTSNWPSRPMLYDMVMLKNP